MQKHIQHNFQGYLLGKLPLLRLLKAHLILNGNFLATTGNVPYYEWGVSLGNLGIKKLRVFRLGFVQRHFNGITENGFNFGIQL